MSQPASLACASTSSSSDQDLAFRVRNFLAAKSHGLRGNLDVIARSGTVTLCGMVGSFYQKQLWIHGAQRVAGVHRVIDNLEVKMLATAS